MKGLLNNIARALSVGLFITNNHLFTGGAASHTQDGNDVGDTPVVPGSGHHQLTAYNDYSKSLSSMQTILEEVKSRIEDIEPIESNEAKQLAVANLRTQPAKKAESLVL